MKRAPGISVPFSGLTSSRRREEVGHFFRVSVVPCGRPEDSSDKDQYDRSKRDDGRHGFSFPWKLEEFRVELLKLSNLFKEMFHVPCVHIDHIEHFDTC
jgi:alpha-galactosidase